MKAHWTRELILSEASGQTPPTSSTVLRELIDGTGNAISIKPGVWTTGIPASHTSPLCIL